MSSSNLLLLLSASRADGSMFSSVPLLIVREKAMAASFVDIWIQVMLNPQKISRSTPNSAGERKL
jgi:hypothetical protein